MSSNPDVPDADRFKEQVRQNWTENAARWQRQYPAHRVMIRPATQAILHAAGVRPGMAVLDIASGTGEPSLTLAETVAPGGHVTATDLIPEMLAAAEANARERGIANVTFRQADAEALPFPDASFDAATCAFGIMFCPNPVRALGEIRRVLRPGGRAAFIAWGPYEQNPLFTTTLGVLTRHVTPPPPPPGTPSAFTFAAPGSLSAALTAAGFSDVREEAHTLPLVYPGRTADFWEFIRDMSSLDRFFDQLPPEQRGPVADEARAEIARYDDGQSVRLTADIVLATAVR
jgi:ubiquinone/menaquinone biosynthesis C-methylase UbiE